MKSLFPQAPLELKRRERGLWAQGEVRKAWLARVPQSRVLKENWRPPLAMGLGEVDLLFVDSASGRLSIVECKFVTKALSGAAMAPLSLKQLARLRRTRGYLATLSSQPVDLILAYCVPGREIVFLKNPC